jgi:predicted NAD-dependent protein-ADP-ribosyltransferase YbiA (DUF1768 family)
VIRFYRVNDPYGAFSNFAKYGFDSLSLLVVGPDSANPYSPAWHFLQFQSPWRARGIDEKNYKDLSSEQLRNQWQTAMNVAGSKFILTPGCSVPNDSTDEELSRLPQVVGA